MINRRELPALAAALLAAPAAVRAAEPAGRPITLVVPFPAGSVTDGVARALAAPLQEALGQPVIIDNRAGAQGTLGAAFVARSPADGHTLLVASSLMFVARSFYRTLSYDPVEGFQPVSGIGATCMVFMVPGASPIRSTADLTARAKQAEPPMSIAYGSPSGQLGLALFAAASGTRPVAVSYRGIPQALVDLVGGHVDAAVVDLGNGLAQGRAGGVRPVVISAGTPAARWRPTCRPCAKPSPPPAARWRRSSPWWRPPGRRRRWCGGSMRRSRRRSRGPRCSSNSPS